MENTTKKSIKTKLIFTYVFLVIALMLILSILCIFNVNSFIMSYAEQQLKDKVLIVKTFIEDNDSLELIADWKKSFLIFEDRITILDAEGNVITDTYDAPENMENHLSRSEVQSALRSGYGSEVRYSDTADIEMLYVAMPIKAKFENKILGVVRMSVPLSAVNASASSFLIILLLSTILSGCLVLIISVKLSDNIVSPIQSMLHMTNKIIAGDFDTKVKLNSEDEIEALGNAINTMSSSLKSQFDVLTEKNDLFTAITDNIVMGLIMLSENNEVIYINEAAKKISDVDDSIIGKPYFNVFRSFEMIKSLDTVHERKEVVKGEEITIYPDNKTLEITAVPCRFDGENAVLLLFYDITERKKIEQMKTDFVADVSHEFKTPLTSIIGFSETMKEMSGVPEVVTDFSSVIHKEANRLNILVQDLLTISRLESGQMPVKYMLLDLNQFLESVVNRLVPVAQRKDISVELMSHVKPADFNGDSSLLDLLFSNLLDNAIKYSGDHSKIEITLSETADSYKVDVKDHGIGISSEDLPYIFHRFYMADKSRNRTHRSTGLGLSIAKYIVMAHHGSITVSSEINRGSTFTVILPKNLTLSE